MRKKLDKRDSKRMTFMRIIELLTVIVDLIAVSIQYYHYYI